MDPYVLDHIKQRHQYQAWRNTTTLSEKLFIWPAALPDDGFPGWAPLSVQAVTSTPQARGGSWPSSVAPRTIQSMWRDAARGREALLSVDLFQCASRWAAHELLLRLLGEFQSLAVERVGGVIGDVCFSGRGRYVVAFARANLVLLMRNAGKGLTPVEELASQFDRRLITRPGAPAAAASEVPSLQLALLPERNNLRVEVVAPHELSMVKFFSASGEIHWLAGRLVYTPIRAGRQELEAYAVSPQGGAARTIQFVMRDV